MKVTNVEAISLVVPIEEKASAPISLPHADKLAGVVFKEYRTTLVRVETDEGLNGVGECMVRLAPQATAEIVDYLAPVVVGQDPRNVGAIWEQLYGTMMNRGHQKGFFMEALSGIDIALWDVAGKAAGLPIYQLLGGAQRERLWTYASSLRFRSWDQTEAKIDEILDCGLRAMKIKIGRNTADPRQDLAFVEAIHDYVPDDVILMVDVNCGYDLGTAVQVGRALEKLDVYWLEEPLPPTDVAGYRELRTKLDIRIAGGETEFTRWGFTNLLSNQALAIIQPNATRAGGISECMKISAISSAFGIPYAPHTGSSGAVCMATALQIAAAIPNFLIYEYMVSDWSAQQPNPLRHNLLKQPVERLEDGYMAIPTGPGLGIELNEDVVDDYRIN